MNRTLTALSILALAASLAAQDAPKQQQPEKGFEVFRGNRPEKESDYQVAKWGPRGLPSPAYAFYARKVLTAVDAPIDNGVVLTKNGTIVAVGRADQVEVPGEYEKVDCGDAWLVPGLVEAHCHIASPSFDLNDTVHSTNPEFRTLDLITLNHDQIKVAQAGGVSTALYIPGSGSNMGGFGTITKTWGRTPEEALVRFPGSLKIAQAGNPERGSGDLGTEMMGMSENIRITLLRGKRYHEQWVAFEQGKGPQPKKQVDLEYLRGLFRHEYPVSVHTQIYQVVLNTLQELRQEMGLWTVIVHGTFDGYRLSEDMMEYGVPIAGGPRQYYFNPRTGRFDGLLGNWYRGGQHGWRESVKGLGRDGIGVNTDSPVVPQEQLPVQAAMAARLGLPHEIAVRGLTINPARFLGIEHRVGSLEVGKDADLGIWSGDPIDPRSHVRTMVINGTICYRRNDARPMW